MVKLLCNYDYPNVSQDFIYDFTRDLAGYIYEANFEEDDFFTETLRQMLKSVRPGGEMVGIHTG